MIRRIALAFQFLTIIPIRLRGEVREEDLAGSAVFFPLVGAFQGLALYLSAVIFSRIFPADINAGMALLVHILLNGGFHLDGLSDTFDALSVKSVGDHVLDRAKRLAVMKDSTTGAIGVVAIVMAVLLKYLFLKSMIGGSFFYALFIMPVLSRWTMVVLAAHGRPAREDGLGRIFIGKVRSGVLLSSTLLAFALSLVLALVLYWAAALFLAGVSPYRAAEFFIASLAGLYAFSFLAIRFFNKKFGGLTGDNIGAASEISEIIFLSGAYIWSRHYI